jgi:hypothetical protein
MSRLSMMLAVPVISLAAVGIWSASPRLCPAQEKPAENTPQGAEKERRSVWMDRKLQYSQELLAGIAAADFDKIVTSAQSMRSLNKVEAFVRSRSSGYRTQLAIFEDSLDEIIRQAEKDNVEGAALGFTQLTISCVNCHKQLRGAK